MHSIEYTPIALRDKKAIASYLAFDCNSPQGAINAIASIDGAIETLKTIPQAGRLIDDDRLENAGYRRIVAGQYWIFIESKMSGRRLSFNASFISGAI